MVGGLLAAAGVFVFLVEVRRFPPSAPPTVAAIVAVGSIALLAFGVVFLRRRIPERRFDETPASYWAMPERRVAAIVLWAVLEGAALLGLIGYLLTGAPAPAVAAGLAIAALAVCRPSSIAGAA
jgi:divalent metal cation (Fe/Co/Zn/Cd) transporter